MEDSSGELDALSMSGEAECLMLFSFSILSSISWSALILCACMAGLSVICAAARLFLRDADAECDVSRLEFG